MMTEKVSVFSTTVNVADCRDLFSEHEVGHRKWSWCAAAIKVNVMRIPLSFKLN